MQNPILSILIPAYNEGQNIYTLLGRVANVTLPYGVAKEVIVVDDGSADNTWAEARRFMHDHPADQIVVLRHDRNRGKGRALRTAMEQMHGDYVIVQDGDLELNPEDIGRLLREMIDGGYPVVYGSRFLEKSNPHLYRRYQLGGAFVSLVVNVLYDQRITDEPTCYKLFRREVLNRISLRCEGFEFCPEVTAKVAKLGIKIKEFPIHYSPRTLEEGKKLRWTDGLEAVWVLLKYRFVN